MKIANLLKNILIYSIFLLFFVIISVLSIKIKLLVRAIIFFLSPVLFYGVYVINITDNLSLVQKLKKGFIRYFLLEALVLAMECLILSFGANLLKRLSGIISLLYYLSPIIILVLIYFVYLLITQNNNLLNNLKISFNQIIIPLFWYIIFLIFSLTITTYGEHYIRLMIN